MTEILNKNFISQYMTKKDVRIAFGVQNTGIENLIDAGWIKKYYQYYRPSERSYEWLCPQSIEIFDAKLLNEKSRFGIGEIKQIFNCDSNIAKIIIVKYFVKTIHNYYKRSDQLDQLLAEGEIILQLK